MEQLKSRTMINVKGVPMRFITENEQDAGEG